MGLVVLSVLALGVGPLLSRAAGNSRRSTEFLDGFVVVSLTGLLIFHVLPHSVALAGWSAGVAAAVGALLPGLSERFSARAGEVVFASQTSAAGPLRKGARPVLLALALAGVAVHAFLDGAVMVPHSGDGGFSRLLGLSVLLHRVPVGIGIWTLLRPAYGLRAAATVAGTLATFSLVGFVAGEEALSGLAGRGLALFQAFVAGGLLHVTFHREGPKKDAATPGAVERRHDALAAGIGALVGAALVVLLSADHPADGPPAFEPPASSAFVGLLLATAPALVVALVLMSALLTAEGFAPASRAGRRLPLPFDFPSLLAAVAISFALLGWRLAVVHLVGALAVLALLAAPGHARDGVSSRASPAVPAASGDARDGVSSRASRAAPGEGGERRALPDGAAPPRQPLPVPPPAAAEDAHAGTAARGPVRAATSAARRSIDGVAPSLMAGAALAALLEPTLGPHALSGLPPALAILGAALVSVPGRLGAPGVALVAATLVHKGLGHGAATALLLTGTALGTGALRRVQDRRGLREGALVSVAALALAVIIGGWVQMAFRGPIPFPLHALASGESRPLLHYSALAVVVGALASALVRQGPRAWLPG